LGERPAHRRRRALERFLATPVASVEASTVGDAFDAVFASRSTLRGYVLDDQGALRRHIADDE